MDTRTNRNGIEVISYTTKETAQFIREALKKNFPGTKFSVTTSYASMTSSTNVTWTDGPTDAEVEAITNRFTSRGFDGMTDSTTYHNQKNEAGFVVSYSGWIHTTRNLSAALLERALGRFQAERAAYGFPPADLHVKEDGKYSYIDGPDRYTHTGMAGQDFRYDCASAATAYARTMRPNGVRIMLKGAA